MGIKHLIWFLSLAVICSGCGSTYQTADNLRFGVDVAKKGLWKEAIDRWNKVLDLDPSNALAYNNLAVAYEQTGKYELAEEAYQKALKLDSTNEWINDNYRSFKEFYAWYQGQEAKKESEKDENPVDEK